MTEIPIRLSDFSDIIQRDQDRTVRNKGNRQSIPLVSTSRVLFNDSKKNMPRRSDQFRLKDLISPSVPRYNSSNNSIRARSHSPIGSPSSSFKAVEKTNFRCNFAAAHDEEEELMQSLDAGKIEEINSSIDRYCSLIIQSNEGTMSRLLNEAQKDLSILGFCHSQLWLFEPGGGLSYKKDDGTRINLSPQRTGDLLESVGMLRPSTAQQKCDIIIVLKPADPFWDEFQSILKSDSNSTKRSKAIHLIPIITSNSTKGFIFATEIETFASATVAKRISNINTSRICSVLAMQWYKQLASTIGWRLNTVYEDKTRVSNNKDKNEDIERTETAEGLLQLYEDLSDTTDICTISSLLASAGKTLFKGSMCFILNPSLQKNESVDESLVTVFTAGSNYKTTPIVPIKVTNRGLITTFISKHDTLLDESEKKTDSDKYTGSSYNSNGNIRSSSSSSSSRIRSNGRKDRNLTTLEVSKDELIKAGLTAQENIERFSIICLSIPTNRIENSLLESDSVKKDDVFCSFVLAFPSTSSSTSTSNITSTSSNDQINSRSMHQQERTKAQLNSLIKIASQAFFRIEKSSLQMMKLGNFLSLQRQRSITSRSLLGWKDATTAEREGT